MIKLEAAKKTEEMNNDASTGSDVMKAVAEKLKLGEQLKDLLTISPWLKQIVHPISLTFIYWPILIY